MSNIAGNNASYWPIDPSSAGPSPAKATSWPFFERPQGIRHHSWSAVESTTESASDGLSDNYILSHRPSVASSSNDPGDPACMDDASTTSIVNAKRPRGRPRKHPIVVADSSTKPVKSRSKTGCLTCRSRKKKCDEAKPVCELLPPRTSFVFGRRREHVIEGTLKNVAYSAMRAAHARDGRVRPSSAEMRCYVCLC